MNSLKKVIYITLLTIIVYFSFVFIESKIVENKYNKTDVYILKENMNKGDKLLSNSFRKIKIITDSKLNYNIDLSKESYLNCDLKKGQIIYKDVLTTKEKLLNASLNKEIVSIPLKYSFDSVSYKVTKDSIVNVYFSAKSKYLDGLTHNKEILQNNNQEGFSTLLFAENTKVIDVVDRDGNSRKDGADFIPDTILIEVSNSDAKLIKNFKNVGEFSLTMER